MHNTIYIIAVSWDCQPTPTVAKDRLIFYFLQYKGHME